MGYPLYMIIPKAMCTAGAVARPKPTRKATGNYTYLRVRPICAFEIPSLPLGRHCRQQSSYCGTTRHILPLVYVLIACVWNKYRCEITCVVGVGTRWAHESWAQIMGPTPTHYVIIRSYHLYVTSGCSGVHYCIIIIT